MAINIELIESVSIVLLLVPIYFFLKAVSYKIIVKIFWGEYEFYNNPVYRQFMSVFVYTGLCPHPNLSESERNDWSKYWWLHGLISIFLFSAIIILTEYFINAKGINNLKG